MPKPKLFDENPPAEAERQPGEEAAQMTTPAISAEIVPAKPQTRAPAKAPLPVGDRGIEIRDLDSLWRLAGMIQASGLAPKGLDTQPSIAIAIQMGLELGLAPMAALQNIAVINGRPGIYGDAALGLVLASGLCEWHREYYEGEGESRAAICVTKRKDTPDPLETIFSVADAKKAKLWGKDGPWTFYPDRMLRFRARGFNLRDNFADVLKGFRTAEEIGDYKEIIEDKETDPPIEMPKRASETPAEVAPA